LNSFIAQNTSSYKNTFIMSDPLRFPFDLSHSTLLLP
jgi:hypothetical protein